MALLPLVRALEARCAELNAKCEALRAGDGECDNDDDD